MVGCDVDDDCGCVSVCVVVWFVVYRGGIVVV